MFLKGFKGNKREFKGKKILVYKNIRGKQNDKCSDTNFVHIK